MNVTICQALCSVSLSVLAYLFVCVLAICYPCPEEGWGYCEKSVLEQVSSAGKSTPEVQRAIKS